MGYVNLFKEIFVIKFKGFQEYKGNFYFMLFFATLLSCGVMLYLLVLQDAFGFNDWGVKEYSFFLFYYTFLNWFSGSLWVGTHLNQVLLQGNLNSFRIRPKNTFFLYISSCFSIISFMTSLFFLFGLIIVIFYFDIVLNNFMYLFALSFLGIFLYASIIIFFDSLAFFVKKNSQFRSAYQNIGGMFERFPINYVGGVKYFSLFYAVIYYGYYGTKLVFNEISISEIQQLLLIEFSILIFFVLANYLVWSYGLKKYEAFG